MELELELVQRWQIAVAILGLCAGCGAGTSQSRASSASPLPDTESAIPAPSMQPATGSVAPDSANPGRLSAMVAMPRAQALAEAGLSAGGTGSALRFTDRNGRNVVVLTVRTSGRRTVSLEADHVLVAADGARRVLRRIRDGVANCDFDVTAGFVPGSLQVADRNRDGLGEVTFAYLTACRSDVSPAALKLPVLQNGSKYILRGETDMSSVGGPTPAPTTAEPSASRWLPGTYRPAAERFRTYQRTAEGLLSGHPAG